MSLLATLDQYKFFWSRTIKLRNKRASQQLSFAMSQHCLHPFRVKHQNVKRLSCPMVSIRGRMRVSHPSGLDGLCFCIVLSSFIALTTAWSNTLWQSQPARGCVCSLPIIKEKSEHQNIRTQGPAAGAEGADAAAAHDDGALPPKNHRESLNQ